MKELEGMKDSDREIIQISEQGNTKKEKDENSSDEDDNDDVDETTADDTQKRQESQMVEMDVAIGNMNSNPLFNSLLTDNDEDTDDKIEKNEEVVLIRNDDNEKNGPAVEQSQNARSKLICVTESTSESKNEISKSKLNSIKNNPLAAFETDNDAPIFMTEVSSKRRRK